MPKLNVTLTRSPIGNPKRQQLTVEALGLRKLHKTVQLPDNISVRGMVKAVAHLVTVEHIAD